MHTYETSYMTKVKFPRLNKNDTIRENDRQIREESRTERAKVTKVVMLTGAEWTEFSVSLLDSRDWLVGTGGTESTFATRYDIETEVHKLMADKVEFDAWRAEAYSLCVLVVNEEDPRASVLVDAQGYDYGRYVGNQVRE